MTSFVNGDVDLSHLNTDSNNHVPDGRYHVALNSMELKLSSSGKHMIAADFIIQSGDWATKHIFVNLILLNNNGADSDSFFVKSCNKFLRSFNVFNDEDVKISTLNKYSFLVDQIFKTVYTSNLTYALEVKSAVSKKGINFTTYKIIEGPWPAIAKQPLPPQPQQQVSYPPQATAPSYPQQQYKQPQADIPDDVIPF